MAKSPLYDNERSQTERDRMDEGEGEAAAEAVKKKDSADESKGEKKTEDSGEAKGEAAMEKAKKSSDKFLEAMKALNKQHETERRDYHGNHREALRQMATRHEKAFRDLVEGFEADDEEGEEVTGTEAAAAADRAMEA